MWSLVPAGTSQDDKDKLKTALDLALKMTPLTPDHHFYMDQGTYARMRLVLMGVGRKLVELGGLASARRHHVPEIRRAAEAQRQSRRPFDARSHRQGARAQAREKRVRDSPAALGRHDHRLVDVRRAIQAGPLGLARHLRAIEERRGAALGIGQGARRLRWRLSKARRVSSNRPSNSIR